MHALLAPAIKFALKKARQNKYIQHLFEAPIEENKFPSMGNFTDSFGNTMTAREGIRRKIRPFWESTDARYPWEDLKYRQKKKEEALIATEKLLDMLRGRGRTIEGSAVVEVGCDTGAATFAYAYFGAKEVLGLDFPAYRSDSEALNATDEARIRDIQQYQETLREKVGSLYSHHAKVSFVDDDICSSRISDACADYLFSSQVLEHLWDLESAFSHMYRALKPGGYMVHEYNPFFCLNGGHGICTLDFLWGHTRLSEKDFIRYYEAFHPKELEEALAFFRHGINRVTIQQVEMMMRKCGFEDISLVPMCKEQHMRMVDSEILNQTRHLYPEAGLLDLCTPRVFVIAGKPKP
jgi:SAM-dependent methyltransferase